MSKKRVEKESDNKAKAAYMRLEALKQDRQNFDQHWQEIADYFIPNKNTITRESTAGEKRNLHIYDSTPIKSNELLAGALHSMLTNPTSYWFEFTTGVPELDKDDDVRLWLQRSAQIMHEVLNNSNFQTEIHELYLDEGSFGIGIMSIEEDDEFVVRFRSRHVSNCWVDENNKGFIDTLFYCYKWKPRQIIAEFGEETPDFVLEKDKSNPEEKLELLQVVEPNQNYDKAKRLSVEGKRYSSCTYIKDGNDHFTLEEQGFNTFPYVTPRWTKGTGEKYGRSPAMTCLPDAKMINAMMQETIRAQQKATNPPMLIPDDGVVGSLRLTPGGLNYYRAGNGDFIKPLQSEVNLVLSFQMLEDVRKRIRDCFYIDQLQLQEGPQMTATEVMQRTEEKIRLLGPILGRQHSELLRPLIERVYEILEKRKLIPQPPQALSGRKIDVKYRSMLAKAQLAQEANNIMRVFQAAAPFIQLDQKAADVINCEEGVKFISNLYGLPQDIMRDKAAVEQIRQGRDQAQAQAVQAAQNQMGAEQVAKVAPAVKIAADVQRGGSPAQ